ncbi:MAG: hypothetical protein CVT67_05455 [Actinobacteria bacterium HGW-Actinobacteria-7]|nr:MAG: hypothetical protein CVT67_05455 [Actinobacteria bacterium HGW-Actinobacteria-7]
MIPSTGIALVDWFLAAMTGWGYLIVLGFTICENIFVLGSFTPGETVVIVAGLVASRGGLNIVWVWLISVAGTIIGSNLSYWLGRRAGIESVRVFVARVAASRIGRFFKVDAAALDDVQEHFDDHGSKTVLISRFAVGAKNMVPAVAGAVHMPVFWYELYTVVGAMLYTSLMCAIGWFLGANMDHALKVASTVTWIGLGLFLAFVALAWLLARRIRARRVAAALEAELADDQPPSQQDAEK